jgi:hypothetical protein
MESAAVERGDICLPLRFLKPADYFSCSDCDCSSVLADLSGSSIVMAICYRVYSFAYHCVFLQGLPSELEFVIVSVNVSEE